MKKANLKVRFSLINLSEIFVIFTVLMLISVAYVTELINVMYNSALDVSTTLIEDHIDQWVTEKINTLDMYEGSIIDTESDTQEGILSYLYTKPIPADFEYMMVSFDSDHGVGTYNSRGEYNSLSDITQKPYFKAHLNGEKYFIGDISVNNLGVRSMPIMKSFSYYNKELEEQASGVIVGFLNPKSLLVFEKHFFETGRFSIMKNNVPILSEFETPTENDMVSSRSISFYNQTWDICSFVSNKEIFDTITYKMRNCMFQTNILGAIICTLCVLFCYIIIFNRLKRNKLKIDELSSGNKDLSKRLDVKRIDEINVLSQSVNSFTEMIQDVVKNISEAKSNLEKTYKGLNENVIKNKSNIEKSMNALLNATQEYSSMNRASETTASAIIQINSNIDSLNKMIENQSSAITEASASIEQMIGNIHSVSKSVESMAQEFEMLQAATKMGIEKNTEVNDLLIKMSESSTVLLEANKAIANVASQTNLLAMNAAIEAAHAGNAGKGFSVVADEIRKLAEESAKQSKQIGTELKRVSEQIELVVGQAEMSTETFKKVDEEISNTSQLVSHIRNAMEEQGQGSKQILEALSDMNNSTLEVKNASAEMKEGSKQINDLMGGLSTSQANLKKAFTEMDTQMSNMQESTSQLSRMNVDLGKNVKDIEEKVDQFKI